MFLYPCWLFSKGIFEQRERLSGICYVVTVTLQMFSMMGQPLDLTLFAILVILEFASLNVEKSRSPFQQGNIYTFFAL